MVSKARLCLSTLLVLNLLVAAAGWGLLCLYRQERATARSLKSGLDQVREALSLEQARSTDRDDALENLGRFLLELQASSQKAQGDRSNATPVSVAQKDAPAVEQSTALWSQLSSLATRPDIDKIEYLSQEEWESLDAKWQGIDINAKKASITFERGVDVDTVLADPHWNPRGRALSLDERIQLAVQLRNLKFFARTLPLEGLHTIILPEADKKRALGNYIEYTGPPPPLPPNAIAHAEVTDVEGVSRIFHFVEQEYPDLYHQLRLEQEQTLKTKVEIYELING